MNLSDYVNNAIKYSLTMQKLIDEHNLMLRWLALIPKIIESSNNGSEEDSQFLLKSFNFLSSFIDILHLTKEEDEIFRYFEEDLDILKIMHDDHEKIRFYTNIFQFAIEENDKKAIAECLYGYRTLLNDHIKNENEIIYPWIDRNLSKSQLRELLIKFNEINLNHHDELIKFEGFVEKMEAKLGT
ncbi:MAG: hemerythrin domain-containing protein [Candidatus Thorarchaeota archaeon]